VGGGWGRVCLRFGGMIYGHSKVNTFDYRH
jgi:hypothetical protein